MTRILTIISAGFTLAICFLHPYYCAADDDSKQKKSHSDTKKKDSPDMSNPKERLKKINEELAKEDDGKLSPKELLERKKRLELEKRRLELMNERRKKLDHPDKLGKLTEEEKRKIDEALKKLHSEPDEHKTGDEAEKENTDKFDGDIDVDPEDDWDEDPELFGD